MIEPEPDPDAIEAAALQALQAKLRWQTKGLSALGRNALLLAARYVDGELAESMDRRDGTGRKVGRDTLGSLDYRGLMELRIDGERTRQVRPLPRRRVADNPEFEALHEAEVVGALTPRGWAVALSLVDWQPGLDLMPVTWTSQPSTPEELVDMCFRAVEDSSGTTAEERAAKAKPPPVITPRPAPTDAERWDSVQAGFAAADDEFAVWAHDLEDAVMSHPEVQEIAAAVLRGEDPWRGPTAPATTRFYWAVEDGDRAKALEIASQEFGRMEFMRAADEEFLGPDGQCALDYIFPEPALAPEELDALAHEWNELGRGDPAVANLLRLFFGRPRGMTMAKFRDYAASLTTLTPTQEG